jgi:two-component system, cell cycle sensor histidine kinase and response regulator CckA
MPDDQRLILAIENLDSDRRRALVERLKCEGFAVTLLDHPGAATSPTAGEASRTRETELALKESEERFAKAFVNLPQPAAITEPSDGTFVDVNQAFEVVFGYSKKDLIGKSSASLGIVSREDRARFLSMLNTNGRVGPLELSLKASGSRRVEVLYYGEAIRFEGRPRLLSMFFDVTEARQKDAALRRAHEQIVLLTNSLREVVLAYDPDRSLQYANPAIEGLTGYSVEEAKRRPFLWWVHPDDRGRILGQWERLLQGATVQEIGYRILTKQGEEKWVEASWGPLRDENGRQVGVRATERDITLRRRAEQERTELLERLSAAQKMESVGRLAGGVAHDFNNLLTVINGYTVMALDQLAPDDALRAPLSEVLRAAARAGALVQQLLAFGRGQVLRPETLDLIGVLRSMEGTLRGLVGEPVQVALDLPQSVAPLFADRRQIEQIVMNLSANARDAMRDGGTVTIAVRNYVLCALCPFCGSRLRLRDYVGLDVLDTGQGMNDYVRRRLFEPFFTTKDIGKGTGLGLATVHGIVSQSGGHVCVDSEPGRGAVFHVFLPAAEPEP